MKAPAVLCVLLAVCGCPLLPALINRIKALFAGRTGPPLQQVYYDLWKLLKKGAVYSRTTTWVFGLAPLVTVAAGLTALLIVPMGRVESVVSFSGDIFFLAYLFGLARFITVLGALDTGSAFEGMGAGREVQFSMLAEPAFLIGIGGIGALTGNMTINGMYQAVARIHGIDTATVVVLLIVTALMIVLLMENTRIPFDDPDTHLELTMIHEVMVLDYSGPDFALIQYGAALKLWIYSALVVGLVLPGAASAGWLNVLIGLGAIILISISIGILESMMARLRLVRVPQLLIGAVIFSTIAVILTLRGQ